MDRERYCRELNRETFLQTLGCRVVSIPHDDVEKRPEVIRFLLKALLIPCANLHGNRTLSTAERETLILAMRQGREVRPVDLVRELRMNNRTAVNILKGLCEKGRMQPIAAGESGRWDQMGQVWEQNMPSARS